MEGRMGRDAELPVFKKAVAYRLNSASSIDSIVNEAMKLSKGNDFVLILKGSREIERRMLPAYVSAAIRQADCSMHSRSLAIETLLFIAGTMNISNAVERVRPAGGEFIVFSTDERCAQSLFSRFRIRRPKKCRLELDPIVTSDVALTAIREDK